MLRRGREEPGPATGKLSPVRLSPDELRLAVGRFPRVRLAHLPTPLEPLPRLSAALGRVDLRMKRDDCTGLALGGNKARQLEFTLGDALAEGANDLGRRS